MEIPKVIYDSFLPFLGFSNPYSSLIFYRRAKLLTRFLILLQITTGLTQRKTLKLEYKNWIAEMDSSIHILSKAWHRKRNHSSGKYLNDKKLEAKDKNSQKSNETGSIHYWQWQLTRISLHSRLLSFAYFTALFSLYLSLATYGF